MTQIRSHNEAIGKEATASVRMIEGKNELKKIIWQVLFMSLLRMPQILLVLKRIEVVT